jgi:hypothetical protein
MAYFKAPNNTHFIFDPDAGLLKFNAPEEVTAFLNTQFSGYAWGTSCRKML